jgi:hypothetical protein
MAANMEGVVATQDAHAGARDAGSVTSLQETICQSKPEHYSRDGARPLLYASVLALSLQYKRLLLFLHKDRSTSGLRDLAPMLACALYSQGMLGAVEPVENYRHSAPGEAEGGDCSVDAFTTAAQVSPCSFVLQHVCGTECVNFPISNPSTFTMQPCSDCALTLVAQCMFSAAASGAWDHCSVPKGNRQL